MPSPFPQSTPTKPTHPRDDGVSSLPTKFSSSSPNDDAKKIAERRRARQSMTPTKPVARFDSICQDSKAILNNMAEMFSPKKGEAGTPGVSPFKIEIEVPPAALPAKKEQTGKDRRDDQGGQGQAQRKKVVNPGRIGRPVHSPVDPAGTPEKGSSKRRP